MIIIMPIKIKDEFKKLSEDEKIEEYKVIFINLLSLIYLYESNQSQFKSN